MSRRVAVLGLIGLLAFVLLWDEQPTSAPLLSEPTAAPTLPPTAAPASPTPALPDTATSLPLITHVIQAGDTPFRIAQQYGVPVDALMRANGITDPTRLRVGDVLVITDNPALAAVLPTLVAALPPPVNASPTPDRSILEPLPLAQTAINGVPFDQIVSLPEGVQQHIRAIYAQGQALGNNPRAFSKLGDSTIEYPYFLARFDEGPYNLGTYAYLQPVINYFSGSFARQSVAIRRGLHTWSVLDPMWSPKPACQPGEHMLACEFRLNRPSLLFIRLGSNDAGIPDRTTENFEDIVRYAIDNGVIPIIGTKADRHEGASDINNTIMRQVAAEYQIPLMDYDRVAQTVPGRGLDQDSVHMTTFYAHDYTQPVAFQRGHGLHNLTALVTLDLIWRALNADGG
jgi:LysM repeat protein